MTQQANVVHAPDGGVESHPVTGSGAVRRIERYFDLILGSIGAVILAAECLVVFWGAFTRYALGSQAIWTDELARILMVWLSFIGGALALERGQHIRVDLLNRYLPARLRGIADSFTLMVSLLFLLLVGQYSLVLLEARSHDLTPILRIPDILNILPLPLGIGLMLFIGLLRLSRASRSDLLGGLALLLASVALFFVVEPALKGLGSGTSTVTYLLIGLVLALFLGVPVAFSLGFTALTFLLIQGTVPMAIAPQRMISGVSSFVLLAVPLFLVAGALMETGGIAQRLVNLAMALVGHIRGGLGMVVVLTEVLFSGISGSTTADVAAVGSVLIPAMRKSGYSSEEAASIVSAASAMGILVPPCVHMVILGGIVSVSVTALFLGGFLPAFVMASALLGLIYLKARRQNWPAATRSSCGQVASATFHSIVPMMTPVIIFGGIFTGAVTITESAVLAVAYAFLVSVLVYKELGLRQLGKVFVDAASASGMVFWLVSTAMVFSWIMTSQRVPLLVGQIITSISPSPMFFLMVTILVYVVFSGILEGLPSLLIFAPVLYPIANQMGINPVHFGIVSIAALGIGFFLPPVGLGLFLACGIARADVVSVTRVFWVYMLVLILALAAVSLFPQITLFLPNLLVPNLTQ